MNHTVGRQKAQNWIDGPLACRAEWLFGTKITLALLLRAVPMLLAKQDCCYFKSDFNPAVQTSLQSLLEMQVLRPNPRPDIIWTLTKSPNDSKAHSVFFWIERTQLIIYSYEYIV